MQKHIKLFLICIVIIIILVFIIFFYLRASQINKQMKINNYNTFYNEKYSYKINYPKEMIISEDDLKKVTFGEIPFEPSPGSMTITVLENNSFNYIDEFKKGYPDGCITNNVSLPNLTNKSLTCKGAFAGQLVKIYFIEKNNTLFQIAYIEGSKGINDIFEKMISSFRFE